jgi:hypothetical protein
LIQVAEPSRRRLNPYPWRREVTVRFASRETVRSASISPASMDAGDALEDLDEAGDPSAVGGGKSVGSETQQLGLLLAAPVQHDVEGRGGEEEDGVEGGEGAGVVGRQCIIDQPPPAAVGVLSRSRSLMDSHEVGVRLCRAPRHQPSIRMTAGRPMKTGQSSTGRRSSARLSKAGRGVVVSGPAALSAATVAASRSRSWVRGGPRVSRSGCRSRARIRRSALVR